MSRDEKYEQIWSSIQDPEDRADFVGASIDVGIAFQIRALRNRQDMTQAKLAEQLNVKQPLVSSWEDPNYGKYRLATLKELAKAFDVALMVRFVRFGELVDLEANLGADKIAPPNFAEEQQTRAFIVKVNALLDGITTSDPSPYDTKKEMPNESARTTA